MAAELVATGPTRDAVDTARQGIRELLGFLYSTPAYWPSLALHGWEEVGPELHALSREGRWTEMSLKISDEMLEAFVPSAPYGEIAEVLLGRFQGLASRLTFPVPSDSAFDEAARETLAALGAAESAG